MTELILPIIIFGFWTLFSLVFIRRYKRSQLVYGTDKNSFWNNSYIFETIPSVFPTLGIFCTALGITLGIWDFDTTDIQGSIPQLLKGLRLAFVATMAGILGLIIFQKINAVIQKQIDDDPNRPRKQTDELSAISELTFAVAELKNDSKIQTDRLIESISQELHNKVHLELSSLLKEIIKLKDDSKLNQNETSNGLKSILNSSDSIIKELSTQFQSLREEQKNTSEKANRNTDEIIRAMSENHKLTTKKFDEFSNLLSKNNTEALVEVMRKTTEQFNAQMSELINRLVQENFKELNQSVKTLNDWQNQNKLQVQKLTEHFQKTTEMFDISASTLREVATNTKTLTSEDGKLSQLVVTLNKVMIDDKKFKDITAMLINTVQILSKTTDSFDETTSKLNDWVKTEKNFKEAAVILISKLEEFRDFNGDVWDTYRKEMTKAVTIVKDTSKRLGEDLDNVNAEFYTRLNDTLNNLDQCIQRFIPTNRK